MQATTIVIVDDEELIRDVACAILKGRGYKVLTAENGEGALALMRENSAGICLMVLDPGIRGLDPWNLVPSLLAMNPDLAIVVSSGSHPEYALREFDLNCISGYIQKPYTASRLRDGVDLALCSRSIAA
jgi:DNA-binding NtrC family response regulator